MDRDDLAKPCCHPASPHTGEPVQALSRAFKAMGDPTRLAILAMLRDCDGSLCACEIEASFDLSQPTISHHLRQLRQAGLVVCERRGSWMHYRLEPESAAAIEGFARGLTSRDPITT
ncbi:MAG TPA: metalloregulator ArsR/SmtB family transcription factor [Candidatus Krumholzibacteria bacterium]|nr:metalloregulator ArsR/SmtB family transcription factor [Candidatus Krumholzibacteria bacterium]